MLFRIFLLSAFFACIALQGSTNAAQVESQKTVNRIDIVLGDITQQSADAIVNAANDRLLPGGGICGAIHRAAGPGLANDCKELGFCPTGDAVVTLSYNLKSKYVIHAVGPIWGGGTNNEAELLKKCYQSIFKIVKEYEMKSVALPAISTGIYGYPKQEATKIALEQAARFSKENPQVKVIFVCFDEETLELYQDLYATQ